MPLFISTAVANVYKHFLNTPPDMLKYVKTCPESNEWGGMLADLYRLGPVIKNKGVSNHVV